MHCGTKSVLSLKQGKVGFDRKAKGVLIFLLFSSEQNTTCIVGLFLSTKWKKPYKNGECYLAWMARERLFIIFERES